ncbi:hypothetical protein ND00_20510 [Clostridium sp. L74]|nr:hypothetical protein ND00_20510 [Clostridium sp. L74]
MKLYFNNNFINVKINKFLAYIILKKIYINKKSYDKFIRILKEIKF